MYYPKNFSVREIVNKLKKKKKKKKFQLWQPLAISGKQILL